MDMKKLAVMTLDETVERRLDYLGKEAWWKELIFHVNTVYNEILTLTPVGSSSCSTASGTSATDCSTNGTEVMANVKSTAITASPYSFQTSGNGTSAQPRNLQWAIMTACQIMTTIDSQRRLQILTYFVTEDEGLLNIITLMGETGLVAPLSIQLSYMLREIVNPRNVGLRTKAIAQLTKDIHALQTLLCLMATLQERLDKSREREAIDEIRMVISNLIWVLSAMSGKDSKFGINLKTLGRIKFVHNVIRENVFHTSVDSHQPFLKVLRTMARCVPCAIILRGDRIFNTIKRLIEMYNYQPSIRFQHILDIMMILTKNASKPKLHARRFQKAGLLPVMIRTFNYWPMWRGKGLLKLSKTMLVVYANLALTQCGRKSLLTTDALVNVRRFCESCPNDKYFDDVVMRACAMIALAHGRNKLPFKDLKSPAQFQIPNYPGMLEASRESGTSSDEDDPDEPEQPVGSEDDERNSDDSDVEQEPSEKGIEVVDSFDDESNSNSKESLTTTTLSRNSNEWNGRKGRRESIQMPQPPLLTPLEKLNSFAHFFKEFDGKFGQKGRFFEDFKESTLLDLLADKLALDGSGEGDECVIPKAEMKYCWFSERPEYANPKIQNDLRKVYLTFSRRVRSVVPFVKIAYPDIALAYNGKRMEQYPVTGDRHTLRSKVLTLMGRAAGAELFKPRVIYDLDILLNPPPPGAVKLGQTVNRANPPPPLPENLGNNDEKEIGIVDRKKDYLFFESRFESGNLRKVMQVGDKEYDLYLTSDVNSCGHNQWFYFQISNIQESLLYTFNVVNCVKASSQFNFGMQPVVFSVMDALDGKPGWVRAGSQVVYHRNGFRNDVTKKTKSYHTASFSIMFHRRGDICYIAYHYPYTYTRMLTELWKIKKEASADKKVFLRYDVLCKSLNQNDVPVVTVTAPNDKSHPIELRDVIFFTARVHPGEPNSSWVMHGILHKLVFGTNVEEILRRYVFKIVPMLNVEGVINGCHRCGLTNEDLNRHWKTPSPILHPSIYNTKALVEYSCRIRNKVPVMYCDLHGHSRRKNVFLYGCSRPLSWWTVDRTKPEDPNVLASLAEGLSKRTPLFSISYCSYDIRKPRESTGRVALWREFGINRSYTLESSYCGCDRGPYKGVSVGINHLIQVGEALCESCEDFYSPPSIAIPLSKSTSECLDGNKSTENLVEASGGSQSEESTSSSEPDSESEEEWSEEALSPVFF